jgi:hypothetical protein
VPSIAHARSWARRSRGGWRERESKSSPRAFGAGEEWGVRELKRAVGRGGEFLGEMRVDYGAVEEMGRLIGWVGSVVGMWRGFYGV